MTSSELKALLRRVDPVAYPELASYSRDEIYGHGDYNATNFQLHNELSRIWLDLGRDRRR